MAERTKKAAEPQTCDVCHKAIVGERPFRVTGMRKLGIAKTCQACAGQIMRGIVPK